MFNSRATFISGQLLMYYKVSGTRITFMFEASKSLGYISIGFGDAMHDSDMVDNFVFLEKNDD